MRPDFVSEANCPTLAKLSHDGVCFRNHHSVYPTATNVNGAAMATGCYPNHSGLLANYVYRPDIELRHPVDTSDPPVIRRGDEVTGGKYLEVPTFVEMLRAAGKRAALVGTKGVAVLFDRKNDWTIANVANKEVPVFAAAPAPAGVRSEIVKSLGPFRSETNATSFDRNRYATRALTEVMWREGVPDFSLLWLSEPDLAQHDHAPGSPEALAAIHQSDDNLALVLKALDDKHVRQSTDVLVVSDHGFSTIGKSFDVIAMLKAAGFHADKEFPNGLERGDIMVAGNGGTCLFYVGEHDAPTTQRLIEWLQHSKFAGVISSRLKAEGTFDLQTLKLDSRNAPDIVVAFRWDDDKNAGGTRGEVAADWNRVAGQGTHATLSRYDIHNTLVAAGPHFQPSTEDNLPTGNIDMAPTVLQLLGVTSAQRMDGRVLLQAFDLKSEPQTKNLRVTSSRWIQSVEVTSVGETSYCNEGNGELARDPSNEFR